MASAFVERCKATYYEIRDAQMARAEAYAIGYETELTLFFAEVETRITYRDVIQQVARELRAEREAERAEAEMWEHVETAYYAPYLDDAMMADVVGEQDCDHLFRTRGAALVYAAVCRQRAIAIRWPRVKSARHATRRVSVICSGTVARTMRSPNGTRRTGGRVDARPPPTVDGPILADALDLAD